MAYERRKGGSVTTDWTDEAAWTLDALRQTVRDVTEEIVRRERLEMAQTVVDNTVSEWQQASGVAGQRTEDNPQPWEPWDGNPLTLPMPGQWFVGPDGGIFESLIPHNSTRPGDPADPQNSMWWRRKPDPEPAPDPDAVQVWVQPIPGLPDRPAYGVGARVAWEGRVWRSEHAANVWPPGSPGTETLWIDEGPAA